MRNSWATLSSEGEIERLVTIHQEQITLIGTKLRPHEELGMMAISSMTWEIYVLSPLPPHTGHDLISLQVYWSVGQR